MRALALPGTIILARKSRLRLGHPVIVLDPVGQQQRTAALLLGILGERDGRRLVGNGVERPGHVVADAAQGRGSGGRDVEPMLLRAAGACTSSLEGSRRRAGDVEVDLAGCAHDQRRVDRHGDRPAEPRKGPAGVYSGKDDRRLAGIDGREDPRRRRGNSPAAPRPASRTPPRRAFSVRRRRRRR